MCGICGEYNYRDPSPVDRDALARMTRTMVHRGPDDEGFHLDDDAGLGLGFRRLSIIDLSPAGHQPMSNADGSIWVVFNGEIYNFPDLRRELEARGHVFRSRSDTEVIVHGYREWGPDVLDRLNGMFGLAVWDRDKRSLMVARDPMGIKTVYYAEQDGRLLFGSEIRPLRDRMGGRGAVDAEAVNLFLRYRYTPAPWTVVEGIRKLAPGERIIAGPGQWRVERWWNSAPEPFDPMPTDAEAEERLLALYTEAVERQLISDVPLGLLLSGGVDSAMLLALMKRQQNAPQTYTVGYGASFKDDELSDAAETARLLGAENASVHLDRAEFESILSRVVSILEEPVASSSVVPMYRVCERARQDVTVALIGQGPDELFGGYKRHLGVRYGAPWRAVPGPLRSALGALLSRTTRSEALRRAIHSLSEPDRLTRYRDVFSLLPGGLVDGLFQDGALSGDCGERLLDQWRQMAPLMEKTDELGGLQFLEIRSSLPDELLMYADKIAMAHSLEGRVPYLDLEVVRYVERLSARFKVRWGRRKWLHRRVCERYLPRAIVNRKKRGFAVNVVDDWYRHSLEGRAGELLLDPQSRLYGLLRRDRVEALAKEHQSGRSDHHKILFSLVMLEEWLRSAEAG